MKYQNAGAYRRQKLAPHHGGEPMDGLAWRLCAAATLTRPELQRLVAAMVD